MTSLKHSPSERLVVGTVRATEDHYTRQLHLTNRRTPLQPENSYQVGSMIGVPKMGVRARVADWPPRRDGGALRHTSAGAETGSSLGSHAKLRTLITPEDSTMYHSIHKTRQSKFHPANRDGSREGHLIKLSDNGGSCHRTRHIRQRSNSDMTLSELDGSGDGGEDWGCAGTKWSPLHREYGSTSSIDQHAVSSSVVSKNRLFEMLMDYQEETQDHCSPAPERLEELLTLNNKLDLLDSGEDMKDGPPSGRLRDRDKQPKRRSKSETGGESIFRKLRTVRAEVGSLKVGSDVEDVKPPLKPWVCQKGFAHYDVQSMLFSLNEVIQNRQSSAATRKNKTSGASAASAFSASATSTLSSTHSLPYSSPGGSQEELNAQDGPSLDTADEEGNGLVLNCPCFCTETGGSIRHRFGPALPGEVGGGGSRGLGGDDLMRRLHCTGAGVAVVEGPKDASSLLNDRENQYVIEHVDLGAYYYRKFFYLRDHWNYFGLDESLGPVAVSIRREKWEEDKEHGQQYNYRIIFRTSELITLRGSILEDAVPSSAKHGTTRGLPLKEVLEYLLPELDVSCLRLAVNTPKVTEQLMKLDEQGLSFQVKVGVMYCRAGQSTEEEMYNNEMAGPAFEEFLQQLGERVRLKGFTKYRAQLDTKTDSTGTHSLYTAYKDYEIMFHVSTMLPYTPNNKQQLLRKRHIGNDIVTIIFQEPGAHPFTPKNIRSHFQHVFIIVRVHNPCSDNTCYSVAISRSSDVPSFGPPIPRDVILPKSTIFRDFLLTKVINAENAAHKSDKFGAMATRTRQEYLRDLAERHVTSTLVEPSGKFPFISLAHKRKEKNRPYGAAELRSLGAITWVVHLEDQTAGAEREGLLAISNEFVIILDQETKALVFSCSVRDVIGWSLGSPASMKIYYERGESVSLRSINNNTEDFSEVVKRLELVTKGGQTKEMTLRRNALGQLGFHVNFEGVVAEVEPYGYAWQAGLRQGSRLVEICKVPVATLSHEQMIDLLRTSVMVRVVIIPPHEDSTPRRGCSEIYHMPLVDYKNHKEGMPYEYKFPFRNNNNKWPRVTTAPQAAVSTSQNRNLSMGATLSKGQSSDYANRVSVIPRSVSSDGRPLNPKRYSPGSDNYALACSIVMGRSPHTRNNQSYSSDATSSASQWYQKSIPDGTPTPNTLFRFNVNRNSPLATECHSMKDGVQVPPSWARVMEGKGASKSSSRTPSDSPLMNETTVFLSIDQQHQKDHNTTLNPNMKSDPTSTSYSASNTLSSTSSSTRSDEKLYDCGGRPVPQLDSNLNGFMAGYPHGASAGARVESSPHGPFPRNADSVPVSITAKPKEKASAHWGEVTPTDRAASEISAPASESSHARDITENQAKSTTAPDASSHTLSDAASHSSTLSSAHSASPLSLTQEDSAPSTSSSTRPSSSPGPKSFYPRQGATSKYLIGWKKPGGTINSVDFGNSRKRHQSDGHVGGHPQLRATMRVTQSPQHPPKSNVEEELKKLITLDSPPPTCSKMKPSFSVSTPCPRPLQRTFSDESIFSGQREPSLGAQGDCLFGHSTMPRSPTVHPPSYAHSAKSLGDLTSMESSGFEQEPHRPPLQDPALIPLPDAGADSGLDWSDLVDAAKAFEVQRATFLATKDVILRSEELASNSQKAEPQAVSLQHVSPSESPACLIGKVSQLESIVKLLQEDLKKEKDAKASLQAQIQSLRADNQRLQEDSHNASAKLKTFTEWVFNTIDMN
ncbi:signal-induced proliferation-associated 1-like protein 1 isoform X1 [Electrophorus electricus]|uniref:signal-induced proliferation-associated 1-like protein 1 isoform X1 n=1 Tax=Electrophorus electricus TaxID=8005 RepID=UPI0015CFB52F|nr:signal-induced proliferation-associated 1-like protein 1 isoform X1 [Electrophorus electricus]